MPFECSFCGSTRRQWRSPRSEQLCVICASAIPGVLLTKFQQMVSVKRLKRRCRAISMLPALSPGERSKYISRLWKSADKILARLRELGVVL